MRLVVLLYSAAPGSQPGLPFAARGDILKSMWNRKRKTEYTLIRSARRSIGLEVTSAGELIVRAPRYASVAQIEALLEEKADWIARAKDRARARAKAAEAAGALTQAELGDLARRARADLPARVQRFADALGVDYGRITIRAQRTRWGSCSAQGNLNFNCLLMLAPEEVRDYVVVHELCHRKQMNHSEAFWAEVERVLPGYREARKWLKTHGQELMQYNTED